jgi:putative holliday junction resolvase
MIGKLLGIDHGLARIGLAVSDATGLVARELAIIRRKSKREDFAQISRVIEQEQVVGIVVGLPNNLDAAPDQYPQADKVRNWVEHLRETTALPIIFWDEQMTSEEAHELAQQKRRKRTEPIDDLAARIILQSYLDALRDGLAELPPELRTE